MSTINRVAHGLVAGQRIVLSSIVGGAPLDPDFPYYVLAAGLTADTFQIAETDGGTPLTFAAITSANMQVVPETEDSDTYGSGVYVPISDPSDAEAPPTTPPTPSAPTVTSSLVSGIVRLKVALNDTAEAKVRSWEVSVTHNFSGSNPDWSSGGTKITMPEGSTSCSIPALGSTVYAVRVSATDVYGNVSAFSPEVTHTTVAGDDSLSAALADLANDVSDGIITETKIADGAISTPKLQARAVTADILAATIVLTSLLKTASTGRRIEIDIDGIRLYDSDESLLVRIPTNGDPSYFKGQVTADSLISQVAASFRGTVDFAGNSVSTLQNGVSTPANVPILTASVDYLPLGATPSNIGAGIAYDSGAGTFWVACDPTISPYYVAQEFNATTGALVRSIPATGSLTTTTTTAGSTSHVADTADGLVGSTDSHIASPVVMPNPAGATNMKITKVAVYMAGRLGTCATRNGVWDSSGNNLRESATYTAASGGATTVGASDLHNATLSSALGVTPGGTYRLGFRRVNTSDSSQHDKDDGSGKTTYSADGTTADGTGWGTRSSASKINVYATVTYDIDTRKETAKMIGVATDGTYVYTLDTLGQVWKYDRSTMAWVANSGVQTAITGTKAQAGLFYDATAAELLITTTTGTGAGVFPKIVRVSPSTLAVSSSVYSASAGPTFNGATDTFRGGVRLADPLNASAATYWIATTSAVYAYTFSGTALTNTANRDFGLATTVGDGITHDGTQFRGWDTASPTKVWKFSNWDWTTASSVYWIGYSWYDSNATGGTHETACGPRASITMRRRERVQVQNAAIPTGGTDDPDKARVYMLPGASDFTAGNAWLQVTDALTSRYLTTYTSSGTHDGAGTAFPSGTPAELRSANATGSGGWSLKGSGGMIGPSGTAFPSSPATNQRFFRTDINGGMWFFYDGTRWLSETLHHLNLTWMPSLGGISATSIIVLGSTPPVSSDIWIDSVDFKFLVSGGTALSASHKWVVVLNKRPTGNTDTAVATFTIDSGSSSVWRSSSSSVGALMNGGTVHYAFATTSTKTGTPGGLFGGFTVAYRIVAT